MVRRVHEPMLEKIFADKPGIEGLLPFVFAIIYIAAQLLSRGKKRTPPVRKAPLPDAEESDDTYAAPEDEIRRFLQSLSGAPARPEPETEPFVPPPPPKPRRRQIRTRRKSREGGLQVAPTPSVDPEPLPGDIFVAPPMEQNRAVRSGTHSLLVDLSAQRIPMPRIASQVLRSTAHSVTPPRLKGRKALRDGMLSHVILGPPLAMGEDRSKYDSRH